MSVQERINQLEPRERMLLNVFVGIVATFLVLVLPIWLATVLSSQRAHNRALRDAIDAIHQARPQLAKHASKRGQVLARYEKKAPALAGFLETQAKKHNLDIPETQPRQVVPHGKDFDQRSERFTLRKVDLLSLVNFMEGISQSGYPVSISELNIRKRSPDSYDVTVVVSAYDRKAGPKEEPPGEGDEAEEVDEAALEGDEL